MVDNESSEAMMINDDKLGFRLLLVIEGGNWDGVHKISSFLSCIYEE